MLLGKIPKQLSEGDCVCANRPVYNESDEIVPLTKKQRFYIILAVLSDGYLVVPLTSNDTYLKVTDKSYVACRDLYILKDADIINLQRNIVDFDSGNTTVSLKNIYDKCYCKIMHDSIKYSEEIKKIFLEEYRKRYHKNFGVHTLFEKMSIVKNEHGYIYLIESVSEYGYYARMINFNGKEYSIDFSRSILLDKNAGYKFLDKMDKVYYNYLLERFKNSQKSKPSNIRRRLKTGDIVLYNDKEYFVIDITNNKSTIIVPYDDNYYLSEFLYVKSGFKFVRGLPHNEKLDFLLKLSNNLSIQRNDKISEIVRVSACNESEKVKKKTK